MATSLEKLLPFFVVWWFFFFKFLWVSCRKTLLKITLRNYIFFDGTGMCIPNC